MCRELNDKMQNYSKSGNYKNNKIEILGLKVTINEMNLINSFSSRLDKPEQRICELKDKSKLISILKHTEAKDKKKNTGKKCERWDIVKKT